MLSLSCILSDLNDFDNTTVRITFDPDELANDDERAAPIRIFNDPVNEANEQVFVVQLRLISSTNPGLVTFTRQPASLCRIVDDDSKYSNEVCATSINLFDNAVIRIGFEEPRYTYMEPDDFDEVIDTNFVSPTNLTANGPIYLAKEDNVQSEQTFRTIVRVTSSVPSANINPATIGVDYSLRIGSLSTVVELLPTMQRVNIEFSLFPDNIPEGTESFYVSFAAEDIAEVGGKVFDLPSYLQPVALFAETYAIIEDDDRKVLLWSIYILYLMFSLMVEW